MYHYHPGCIEYFAVGTDQSGFMGIALLFRRSIDRLRAAARILVLSPAQQMMEFSAKPVADSVQVAAPGMAGLVGVTGLDGKAIERNGIEYQAWRKADE